MVERLCEELVAFRRENTERLEHARQAAALFIVAGFDLDEALNATQSERTRLVIRLERLIERERQRGVRRHWSYDLNRHIALKQALDRLLLPDSGKQKTAPGGAAIARQTA